MSRWFGHLGAILAVATALGLTGCSAAVDAEGKVISNRVWFDQAGGAHCPACDPFDAWAQRHLEGLKGQKTEDPPSLVKPHANVCAQDAKHAVVWAAEDVTCWRCSGSGLCQDCRGSGIGAAGKPCAGCFELDEDGRPTGTGRCLHCKGKGTIRYGATGNFGS